MNFNSLPFLFIFFPLVAVVSYFLDRLTNRMPVKAWLLLSSFIFYSWLDFRFAIFLGAFAIANYPLGQVILSNAPSRQRQVLLLAILLNLIPLLFLKWAMSISSLIIPMGVSFISFRQIMYLFDLQSGEVKRATLFDYLLFISFFPCIGAGPLTRFGALTPQFNHPVNLQQRQTLIASGLVRFSLGFFEKAFISQSLSPMLNEGLKNPDLLCSSSAAFIIFLGTLRIYFDLVGYTDMALGLANILGIELPEDFDAPLLCTDITRFWKCWHKTLTRFFFDYLYMPLARLNQNPSRIYLSALTIVTMCIIGLWHGLTSNFILFGLIHGLALVLCSAWKSLKRPLPRVLSWFLTAGFVSLTFVFYIARTSEEAFKIYLSLFHFHGDSSISTIFAMTPIKSAFTSLVLFTAITVIATKRTAVKALGDRLPFTLSFRILFSTVIRLVLSLLALNSNLNDGFIYLGF